jgi:hypothetical protein
VRWNNSAAGRAARARYQLFSADMSQAHGNKKLRRVGDKFCLFKSCTTFYAVAALAHK